ncbi:MAG: hypothetical protein E6G68_05770 [Actinobacteria bacterium]|nr:MAG: hypothetical protein E6G68_05770 [Actinomycetota bacterium]
MSTRNAGRTWRHEEARLPGVKGPLIRGGAPRGSITGEAALPVFFSPRNGVIQLQIFDRSTQSDSNTVLCVTADAGRHWSRTPLPRGVRPFDPTFVDGQHWWLLDGGKRPLLYLTKDAGRTWRKVRPEVDLSGYGLAVVRPGVAYAFDTMSAKVLRSVDGGRTWRRYTPRIVP